MCPYNNEKQPRIICKRISITGGKMPEINTEELEKMKQVYLELEEEIEEREE